MKAMPRATVRSAVVALAAVAGVWATARLGLWQLDRAAQKQALQQTLNARAALPPLKMLELATTPAAAAGQHFRRIEAAGRWLPGATVFLDNRQMAGRVGFFVVTPLQPVDGSAAVLVQRGFAPRDNDDRTRLPPLLVDAGIVRFAGHVAPAPPQLYEFAAASAASGAIRQNLSLPAFAAETGLHLRPLSVVQDEPFAAVPDGLRRQWPAPAVDVQKHYGYAFQWFALCALITGLYVWFQLVRPRFHRAAA